MHDFVCVVKQTRHDQMAHQNASERKTLFIHL